MLVVWPFIERQVFHIHYKLDEIWMNVLNLMCHLSERVLFFVHPAPYQVFIRRRIFVYIKHLLVMKRHFLLVQQVNQQVSEAFKVILSGGVFEIQLSYR